MDPSFIRKHFRRLNYAWNITFATLSLTL